jgi:hypothetical protein
MKCRGNSGSIIWDGVGAKARTGPGYVKIAAKQSPIKE